MRFFCICDRLVTVQAVTFRLRVMVEESWRKMQVNEPTGQKNSAGRRGGGGGGGGIQKAEQQRRKCAGKKNLE